MNADLLLFFYFRCIIGSFGPLRNKNDVIIYICVIHFPVIFVLRIDGIYSATIQDINEDYQLKIGKVIAFSNDMIYYWTPCILLCFISSVQSTYRSRKSTPSLKCIMTVIFKVLSNNIYLMR